MRLGLFLHIWLVREWFVHHNPNFHIWFEVPSWSSKSSWSDNRWFHKTDYLENLLQVFSCEFYKIFKNSFFIEHLWWLLLEKVQPATLLRKRQHRCFLVKFAKFQEHLFYRTLPGGCFSYVKSRGIIFWCILRYCLQPK